ncbi:MAG: DUF4926 domain-containing protein [Rhodocyclaceae bacterium]|nr:DUF4926 domain-containing protein [Rhodocyclaceae bacterium]
MIQEHDLVVLTENLPDQALEAGDVGVVVHVYPGAEAFEVEFLTLNGETTALATLRKHQLRSAGPRDIPHVRERLVA